MISSYSKPIPWSIKAGAIAMLAAFALVLGFGTAGARAAYTTQTGITYGDAAPANPALNQLDLYLPQGESKALRPVIVWVHGGGWQGGDKGNRMAKKATLFTDAGYILASVNYRLSPRLTSTGGPPTFSPDRVMFPDHPRDVAGALAWISDNIRGFGGNPDALVLLGHSAGAHLVSLIGSDPSWLNGYGKSLKQVAGVVSLDAGVQDVVDSATQQRAQPTDNNYLIWNAFGTPAENALRPRWHDASPTTWGDPSDPRSLLVTQSGRPLRIADNQKMAKALGQDPNDVFTVPLSHEGINDALGDPGDLTGETGEVMAFIRGRLAARPEPRVSIRKRPARVVRVGRNARTGKAKKRRVRFVFTGSGNFRGFQCRIDRGRYRACSSPRNYWVGRGRHAFRVRPLHPSGRPGLEKLVKFELRVKKPKKRRG